MNISTYICENNNRNMANVLTSPAKLTEATKSLRVNWRIFTTIVLFTFTINLAVLSEGLFLMEILIAGGIISALMILSQLAPKATREKY